MAVTTTAAVKNARLDAISSTWGANPKLRFYSGSIPADVNAALIGSNQVLLEVTISPAAAAGGSKNMLGGARTGTGTAAAGSGTPATFYRIYDNAGTTAFEQGTVSNTGSPDITIDNPSIAQGQTVNVNTFTKNEP